MKTKVFLCILLSSLFILYTTFEFGRKQGYADVKIKVGETTLLQKHEQTKEKVLFKEEKSDSSQKHNFKTLVNIHDKIWKQIEILQEQGECESKKILYCENIGNYAGMGSMVHRFGVCLQIAFGLGRIVFIKQKEYEHFGGFSDWMMPESKKCGYLKAKYFNYKHSCNMQQRQCYLENGYDIDNSYKVLVYNSIPDFPAPRHIPTTIPKEIRLALLSHPIYKPWLWFSSQFLGYLLLRVNDAFKMKIKKITEGLHLGYPFVAMHVRRGDKIISGESNLVSEKLYANEAVRYFTEHFPTIQEKKIFVASDSRTTIDNIRHFLPQEYKLFELPANVLSKNQGSYFQRGFPKEIFTSLLLDLHFLVYSNYTICTFSSNLCRLVYELKNAIPPYIGYKNVVSMDNPKSMVYLWHGFADYWIRYQWVSTSANPQKIIIDGKKVLKYEPGQLFDVSANKTFTLVASDGKKTIYCYVYRNFQRGYKNNEGYVIQDHLIKWPGNPSYHFYPDSG
ncbi:alpha-(1,6)-fucosyltransferase-like [Hydractinia symbiolongicarpus]|uniref:alpha-(1,6)-fucosyltransferase-like n=1 Tax=Hydractinia symbiolongicarpus TaxID=13093 RepID=UPI0025518D44|nr:alpha-(1,6)-fucosyltransferase-like [Hydractinia symbiolongicarpus]